MEITVETEIAQKMERKQTIRVLRDPSTGLGFGLNNGSDGLPEVGIVVPGSPAARVGLRRGDKVARINGRSASNLRTCSSYSERGGGVRVRGGGKWAHSAVCFGSSDVIIQVTRLREYRAPNL